MKDVTAQEPKTPDQKIRRALFLIKDRLDAPQQEQLRALVDTAPAPIIGRDPSVEEEKISENFKSNAKAFLNNLPPETGITYDDAMQEVRKEELKKQKKSKQPELAPASPTPTPRRRSSKSPRVSSMKSPKSPRKSAKGKRRKARGTLAEYLCLVDFMATCDDGPPPRPQEIIEFPAVLFNARTGVIRDTFHCYIRPDVHPTLSDYCVELTGITQDMVDKGVSLFEALRLHEEWLTETHGLVSIGKDTLRTVDHDPTSTFIYATCGDWDLRVCLANQLEYHNKKVPEAFKSWINIKWPFESLFNKKVQGIADMVQELELESETAQNQTGLDDCRSLADVCLTMISHGWRPIPTAGEGRVGSRLFWELQGKKPWPPQPDPISPYKMVYLIRHGQCETEANGDNQGRRNHNLRDCGLTERGVFEAKALQDILSDEQLASIQLVLTSPLKRAIHTSLLGFPDHDIMVSHDLSEIGRDCPENTPRAVEEVLLELEEEVKERSEQVTFDYHTLEPKRPSMDSPKRKLSRFFEWLYMERNEQAFGVVCHANVIRTAVYGASTPLSPDNATPIKCQLFMNGNLVPV